MVDNQKRKHVRVRPASEEPIEIQIMGRGTVRGLFMDVLHARDISIGGVGIMVPHNFKGCDINSTVELVVTLPGRGSFSAQGKVIYKVGRAGARGFFGVQFVRIAEYDRDEIGRYVEERLALEE